MFQQYFIFNLSIQGLKRYTRKFMAKVTNGNKGHIGFIVRGYSEKFFPFYYKIENPT